MVKTRGKCPVTVLSSSFEDEEEVNDHDKFEDCNSDDNDDDIDEEEDDNKDGKEEDETEEDDTNDDRHDDEDSDNDEESLSKKVIHLLQVFSVVLLILSSNFIFMNSISTFNFINCVILHFRT